MLLVLSWPELVDRYKEACSRHLAGSADKYSTWEVEQQQDDYDDHDDYDRRESYGQYEGSYAQDVEGLSDDFINDVLDGDPDAYWNID